MKNCSKQILANSLLEWTMGSKTTFFNAEENKTLAEKAIKLGIELPSPDLAAFETIYCEVDKFNLNGVKIPKKVAEKGIKTLIGKQVNWNHEGAHQICGYIIDSFIKEDKIYIDGILFKSSFVDEFSTVQKLFAGGKLFVSFELWNRTEKGKSIIKELGNNKRELIEMVAHGCALLLLGEDGKPIPPACPQAQVQKLLASEKIIQEAEQIIDKVFEKDERLVYAELATNEECLKCKVCTCIKEGGKENIMLEEKVEDIQPRLCPECQQPMKDEEVDLCAECLKKKEEMKLAEKVKTDEIPQPIPEVKPEPAQVVPPVEVKPEPAQVVEQLKEESKVEEVKSEEVIEVKFTQAEVDAKVAEAKAELETKLVEKDKEIENMKQELGKKDQEIAELKKPKDVVQAEVEEPKVELEVGNADQKGKSSLLERRERLDIQAYGTKKDKK